MPENCINFTKVYDPFDQKNRYQIRLFDSNEVRIPVLAVKPEHGSMSVIVFTLEDGAYIPEDDFFILIHGAIGYMFEVTLPSTASPDYKYIEFIDKVLQDKASYEKIRGCVEFTDNDCTYIPVKTSLPGAEVLAALQQLRRDIEAQLKADKESDKKNGR